MSSVNTGGPAFPLKEPLSCDQEGMTLRDYFAANAMSSFIHEVFSGNLTDHGYGSVARHAYQMADAMLKARDE